MSIIRLVWSYLKAKPFYTTLNILVLALGIAVITILLLVSKQLEEKISSNTKGVDLVVGAKGSPLQLILCNIFHLDFPTGNITLKEAELLSTHRLVKNAIPLALGDSFNNFRIIGTDVSYPKLYRAELSAGSWWKSDLEVVIGATAARILHLKVGDSFASMHGLVSDGAAHSENLFRVVGILTSTKSVMDNLILTSVESVWKVHEHEPQLNADSLKARPMHPSPLVPSVEAGDSTREITSLLIKFRNPLAAIQLPRYINAQTNMQAASPSFETARLFSILGVGVDVILSLAYVLIFISALSIFIALYNSMKERQYDLAIMRSMGASRGKLFYATIVEGTTLTLLGSIKGLALGHIALFAFTVLVAESQKTGIEAWAMYPEEVLLLMGSFMLGVICSLIPAIQAYRTDIHKVLAGS